jgi:hypothetical protein
MVRAPTWQLNFGFSYAMLIAGDYNLIFTNDNAYLSEFPTALAAGRANNDESSPLTPSSI